jgi:hypothetical protein
MRRARGGGIPAPRTRRQLLRSVRSHTAVRKDRVRGQRAVHVLLYGIRGASAATAHQADR